MSPLPSSQTLSQQLGISDVAATFVDLVHMTASGASTVDVFSTLAARCIEIIPIEASGILLFDVDHGLQVIGSSSHSAHLLDLFQVQNDNGPCLACCRDGKMVSDTELSPNGPWPQFSALARNHGFTAVYAIALKAKEHVLGALNLFSTRELTEKELLLAQALTDVATIAFLQADPDQDAFVLARQHNTALIARNTMEQAKGVLCQRYTIDLDQAYTRILRVASSLNMGVVQLSTAIVNRTIDSDTSSALDNAYTPYI